MEIVFFSANENAKYVKTTISFNSINKRNQSNCKSLNCEYENSDYLKIKNPELIRKAFLAGIDIDGEPLFVCRVKQFNELIPGKLSPNINSCSITHNKKEFHFTKYQLLVESKYGLYNWTQVRRPAKKLPDNIVVGGRGVKGQFYYISRCRVRSEKIKFISEQIGKVNWNGFEWIGSVPFRGQEVECFDYSVLIMI